MMIRGEVLTLVRQRLLFWVLGVGAIVLLAPLFTLLVGAINEASFESASTAIFGWYGSVPALMLGVVYGASAATADYGSGVIRDYALTGVARWKIHASQLLAGLAVLNGLVLTGMAVSLAAAKVVATAPPDMYTSQVPLLRAALAVLVIGTVTVFVSHAVGSIVRSRGITIGIIAVYVVGIEQVLAMFFKGDRFALTHNVGSFLTDVLDQSAQSAPTAGSQGATVAALVTLGWVVVLQAAALARFRRADL